MAKIESVRDRQVALHKAAGGGDAATVSSMLAEGGLDLEYKGGDSRTALSAAANWGHVECVKLLIEAGARVDGGDICGTSAMAWAASKGRVDCIKVLLAAGARVNARDNDDMDALVSAAWKGYPECVEVLASAGADLEALRRGLSPLMFAVSGVSGLAHACASTLLAAGVDVDARGVDGRTALMAACHSGHADCVDLLLAHGARGDLRDADGNTAMDCAVKTGMPGTQECARVLETRASRVEREALEGCVGVAPSENAGSIRI